MITAGGFRIGTTTITHEMHAPDAVAFLNGELRVLPFDAARSHLRLGELV